MFCPEHPKWDQNAKIYTHKRDYEHPCPFQMGVTPGNLPGSLLWSCPMKQLVAQVIVALVVEQGTLIIAAVFLLCQLCRYVLLNATYVDYPRGFHIQSLKYIPRGKRYSNH